MALSPNIERTPTKRYYSYKVKNVFTAIDIQKQRLKVFLYIPYEQVRFSDNSYREKLGFTLWEGKAAFFFEHLSDIAVVKKHIHAKNGYQHTHVWYPFFQRHHPPAITSCY